MYMAQGSSGSSYTLIRKLALAMEAETCIIHAVYKEGCRMQEEENFLVKHRHEGIADRGDKHNVNSKGRDAT